MDLLSEGVSPEAFRNLYIGCELEMLWHCRADPRFHYFACIPETVYDKNPPTYRVMCFVHGSGRTTERYRELFADFAARNDLIVLYPMFPGGVLEQEDFNSYKLLSYQGIRYDLVLLSMVEELAQRYPVDTKRIFLYGWSGGGQFVQRFLCVHPDRLAAASIGAPGRITYLDDTRDFYWGTRDFEKYFDKRPDIEEIRKVPIRLMIGEQDTKYIGDSPFGDNRRERIENLKKNYAEHGIESDLHVIKGFDHKGGDEEKSKVVIDFFAQTIEREKRAAKR